MNDEQRLIAAIAGGDHETRIVYMDWLEQHEDFERLEYLRLDELLHEMAPYDSRHAATFDRHRQLEDLHEHWCQEIGRAHVRRRLVESMPLHTAITDASPVAFEDLLRLAVRLRSLAPSAPAEPWELPEQLRYLEVVHANANRRS